MSNRQPAPSVENVPERGDRARRGVTVVSSDGVQPAQHDPAWGAALGLAWDAYVAGTIPVGAVVTDSDGTILARGRNRMYNVGAPTGQIHGSRVAHAEINALVQLGTDRRYHDCTLWTTLEPCAQCVSAAWLSTIGRVRFAASDVYAGASKLIERQIEAAESARRFPMPVEGPEAGSLALLAELLPVSYFLDADEHRVTETYRERRPEIVKLAERLKLKKHSGASLSQIEAIVAQALRQSFA